MPDIYFDVDVALSEVPVNVFPLTDDTDFKTREVAVAYNAAGMDLVWNFVTSAGVFTQTAVTPTTAGAYDWTHQGDGMYTIEIPASGGASINNNTEGYGWFTGVATGVLPWRGPIIGFRAAAINDALCDGGDVLDVNTIQIEGADATDQISAASGGVDIRIASGTAQAVTSTTIQLASASTFANDEIIGSIVVVTGGSAGVGQCRYISDYVGSTDTATISPAWTTTPTGTVTYSIYPGPPAPTDSAVLPSVKVAEILQAALADLFNTDSGTTYASAVAGSVVKEIADNAGGSALTVGAIADAVWDEALAGHATAGTAGANLSTAASASGLDAAGVRAAIGLASANLDTQLADIPTVSEFNARTLAAADYATATNLATVAGYVDTEVAAILAIAQKLDGMLELDSTVYRFTVNALEQAPSGGAGTADWTADERTAIRAILGIPASGTAPADPSAGILDTIRDAVAAAASNVTAILQDTGTDIPALIAALNDIAVSDVLTTQMTESYAANGTAPTLAQAIFAIHQHLMDFVISGTTKTVRRLDSSTTAFTETLNDATSPTGITR